MDSSTLMGKSALVWKLHLTWSYHKLMKGLTLDTNKPGRTWDSSVVCLGFYLYRAIALSPTSLSRLSDISTFLDVLFFEVFVKSCVCSELSKKAPNPVCLLVMYYYVLTRLPVVQHNLCMYVRCFIQKLYWSINVSTCVLSGNVSVEVELKEMSLHKRYSSVLQRNPL